MAVAHHHLGNSNKALSLLDQARCTFLEDRKESWVATSQLYTGTLYFHSGRYFEAKSLARKALKFLKAHVKKTRQK